jgi:hypothetical protein
VGISSVGSLEPTLLPRLLAPLFSVSGSDKSHRRKKRSRRKKAEDDTYLESDDIAEVKESTTAVPSSGTLQPRKESPPLKIKDVRELVGSTTTYSRTPSSSSSNDESGKKSSARASSPVTTSIKNLDSVAGDDSENDPLARLLADAKEMQAMNSKDDVVGETLRKGGGGVGNTVRNIISTIVTVDFFVVCALLVWFLAGIFCSYVIKVRISLLANTIFFAAGRHMYG